MIGLGMWGNSVEKQEGKRPSARPRHTLEDYIKNNLKETSLTWSELLWIRIGTSSRRS
jgi:hypothetical protein